MVESYYQHARAGYKQIQKDVDFGNGMDILIPTKKSKRGNISQDFDQLLCDHLDGKLSDFKFVGANDGKAPSRTAVTLHRNRAIHRCRDAACPKFSNWQ